MYREAMSEKLQSLHDFLHEKGLYTKTEHKFDSLNDFELRRSQLTEAGFLFVWRYLDGYLDHLEKTGRLKNPDYLAACWQDLEDSA